MFAVIRLLFREALSENINGNNFFYIVDQYITLQEHYWGLKNWLRC